MSHPKNAERVGKTKRDPSIHVSRGIDPAPVARVRSLYFSASNSYWPSLAEQVFPAMPCDDIAMRSKDFSGLAGAKA